VSLAKWIGEAGTAGILPSEIGLFVRISNELPRARAAVQSSGREVVELYEHDSGPVTGISIGTMHLGKGLEFKAVAVMACDDEILPLQARVEAVADEIDLDDVYETERQLLYVACTRARDRLSVSGAAPASEFLRDMGLYGNSAQHLDLGSVSDAVCDDRIIAAMSAAASLIKFFMTFPLGLCERQYAPTSLAIASHVTQNS
jgi:ATP-dependent exoDNAse (exonuclease V) beta subunit